MRYFLLSIIVICFLPQTAYAQTRQNEGVKDVVNYIPATFQNLAFSLWSMGAHPTDNDAALDAYLQITQCPLYQTYKEEDFIWQNIREGLRREIDYFADEYPKRFYIDSLVAIDRYDFESSAFRLLEKFQFSNAGSIRFPFFGLNTPICGYDEYWHYFPLQMSFLSDLEFALEEILIPPNQADALLQEIRQYKYPSLRKIERVLPVRFEITVNGYEFTERPRGVVLRGDMDRIVAYKDPGRQHPIWSREFKLFD
jgi:hypothetical protein